MPPVILGDVERSLASIDSTRATEASERVASAACRLDTLPIVDSFLRDYDRVSEAIEGAS